MPIWVVFREEPFYTVEAKTKDEASKRCDEQFGTQGWTRLQSQASIKVARHEAHPDGNGNGNYADFIYRIP